MEDAELLKSAMMNVHKEDAVIVGLERALKNARDKRRSAHGHLEHLYWLIRGLTKEEYDAVIEASGFTRDQIQQTINRR